MTGFGKLYKFHHVYYYMYIIIIYIYKSNTIKRSNINKYNHIIKDK